LHPLKERTGLQIEREVNQDRKRGEKIRDSTSAGMDQYRIKFFEEME